MCGVVLSCTVERVSYGEDSVTGREEIDKALGQDVKVIDRPRILPLLGTPYGSSPALEFVTFWLSLTRCDWQWGQIPLPRSYHLASLSYLSVASHLSSTVSALFCLALLLHTTSSPTTTNKGMLHMCLLLQSTPYRNEISLHLLLLLVQ